MFDYENDTYGKECLIEAEKSKGRIGFGALLVKNNDILGRGWNHRPRPEERGIITHVDYAIHGFPATHQNRTYSYFPCQTKRQTICQQ